MKYHMCLHDPHIYNKMIKLNK